jgi:hypothetical protein
METVLVAVISAVIAGVLGWLARGWIGGPISDARDKRIRALRAADENAYVGYTAANERIAEARAALRDTISALRSTSRGQPWSVRAYCRLCGYDLEAAAGWLTTLHNMAGKSSYVPIEEDNKNRRFVLDAVHVCLGAYWHLSRERVGEIRRHMEEANRSEETNA